MHTFNRQRKHYTISAAWGSLNNFIKLVYSNNRPDQISTFKIVFSGVNLYVYKYVVKISKLVLDNTCLTSFTVSMRSVNYLCKYR